MIELWPLLLPAAAWSGWRAARCHYSKPSQKRENHLSREYVLGLNYLLNEQADKAVDIFIKLLDVDSDTVETHLALGSLFRRRGEVDRAIRIHQNLIARPQLSFEERKESLIALGQDYMSAGLFDRAERIFLEVVELGGNKDVGSLQGLLAIYQQERSWENALQVIKKLENASGQSMHKQAAHYYCEIAEQSIKSKTFEKAQYAIKQALSIDKQSVRANLLQASLNIDNKRFKQAIRSLKRIAQQDPEFLCEIITPLITCHQQLGTMDDCVAFLQETLVKSPRVSTLFVIAEEMKRNRGVEAAIDYVSQKLGEYPSLRGLNRLIAWHLETAHGKVKEKLQILDQITTKLLVTKPIYRCNHCGFGGKHLHWHCPSCKQWGKMKPVNGLEGD